MATSQSSSEWKEREIFDHLLEGAIIQTSDSHQLMLRAQDLALTPSNLRTILSDKKPASIAFEQELEKFANAPKRVVVPLVAYLRYNEFNTALGNGGMRRLANTVDILLHAQITGMTGIVDMLKNEIEKGFPKMRHSFDRLQKIHDSGVLHEYIIDYAKKLSMGTDIDLNRAALEQLSQAVVKIDGFAAILGDFLHTGSNAAVYVELHELVARASDTASKIRDQDNDADTNNLPIATIEGSSTTPNPHVVSVLYTNPATPFKVGTGATGDSGANKRKAVAAARYEDMSSFADFENATENNQKTCAKAPLPSTATVRGNADSSVTPAEIPKKSTTRGKAEVTKKAKPKPQY